jgi:YD repeat-containing protein
MARRRTGPLLLALLAALAPACEELPNVVPVAAFIFTPVSPILAGSTVVVFNAAASQDSDGQITTYVWNFGDRSSEQTVSAASITHVFPNTPNTCLSVTYAVLLTVIDNAGARATASQNVSVVEDCRP